MDEQKRTIIQRHMEELSINPDLLDEAEEYFASRPNSKPSPSNLKAFIAFRFFNLHGSKTKPCTASTKQYWLFRGWTERDAEIKAQAHKLNRRSQGITSISPFSQEFWLNRINPSTGEKYTIEEADFVRNSYRPIRKEYWLVRGYSETESQQLAIDAKQTNNKKGGYAKKNAFHGSVNKIGFWEARGFTEAESIEKISVLQKTFSLDICINKYGPEEGLRVFNARQEKWLTSLYSNSTNDIADMIRRRTTHHRGNKSPMASSLFKLIHVEGARWGDSSDSGNSEFYVQVPSRRRGFLVDYKLGNKIIEFFGDYWHANPDVYNTDDVISKFERHGRSLNEIRRKDSDRVRILEQLGYEVLIVWEADYKRDPETTVKKCKEFLNDAT